MTDMPFSSRSARDATIMISRPTIWPPIFGVKASMVRSAHHLQIRRLIVGLDLIDVMDDFPRQQRSSHHLLRHDAMFERVPPIGQRHSRIPLAILHTALIPAAVRSVSTAFTRAEVGVVDTAELNLKLLTTRFTCLVNKVGLCGCGTSPRTKGSQSRRAPKKRDAARGADSICGASFCQVSATFRAKSTRLRRVAEKRDAALSAGEGTLLGHLMTSNIGLRVSRRGQLALRSGTFRYPNYTKKPTNKPFLLNRDSISAQAAEAKE